MARMVFFRQQRSQFLIEFDLFLGNLCQGLNDQVGVLHRPGQVGGQGQAGQSCVRLGDQPVDLLRSVGAAVVQQTGTIGARGGLGGSEFRHIDVVKPLQLGLGPADGGIAPQPDGDVKAFVGGLVGNLTAQHAAADENHILNAHCAASC